MTKALKFGVLSAVGCIALTGCFAPLEHMRMRINEDFESLLRDEEEKEELRLEVAQTERDTAQAVAIGAYQCGAALRVEIDGSTYQRAVDYLEGDEPFRVSVQAITSLRFYYTDATGVREFMDLDAGETRFLVTDTFEPAVDRDAAFCLNAG